jgi:ribonuclease J
MKLVIHRGAKEIGGSCVEVSTGTTRLVLDLGLPLVTADRTPFDTCAALRKSTAALIADGTIRPVAGLFKHDGPPPDAILLSHAHLDHMGLIARSRPDVPVYATTGTSKMMLAGSLFAGRAALNRARHRPVRSGHSFTIGDVTVMPLAVDHSTFGSVAFLLEANGKRLLYTGDLRTHGRKPGMKKALLAAIRSRPIDVLLVEGTHLGRGGEQRVTEYAVEREVVRHVRAAPGLVLAAFSPQDVDRLVTIYRAAVRTGRTFVADAYAATVMHLVSGEAYIPRPVRSKGIRVFYNAAFRRKNNHKLIALFERSRIDLAEVLAQPDKHLMVFRPSMTALDFRRQLPSKVRVLYGYWKGYLDNPDWVALMQQVKQVDGEFIPAHASGHIYIDDLVEFTRAVKARTVIPIHTFEPEQFRTHFANAVVLRDGQVHQIE